MPDYSQLYEFDWRYTNPYPVPSYWPYAPQHAPQFDVYFAIFSQRGTTTLDTYVAPGPRGATDTHQSLAVAGNGLVYTGNAPTSGVYTGVQQE